MIKASHIPDSEALVTKGNDIMNNQRLKRKLKVERRKLNREENKSAIKVMQHHKAYLKSSQPNRGCNGYKTLLFSNAFIAKSFLYSCYQLLIQITYDKNHHYSQSQSSRPPMTKMDVFIFAWITLSLRS